MLGIMIKPLKDWSNYWRSCGISFTMYGIPHFSSLAVSAFHLRKKKFALFSKKVGLNRSYINLILTDVNNIWYFVYSQKIKR